MEHVVEIVMPLFQRYKFRQYFPHLIEYRASTLVNNIIMYEFFCLLVPDQIRNEPLNVMQMRSNGLYTTILSPCGHSKEEFKLVMFLHFYKYRKENSEFHGKGIYLLY